MKDLDISFSDLAIFVSIVLAEAGILWKIFQMYSEVLLRTESITNLKEDVKILIKEMGELEKEFKIIENDLNKGFGVERRDVEFLSRRIDRLEEHTFTSKGFLGSNDRQHQGDFI